MVKSRGEVDDPKEVLCKPWSIVCASYEHVSMFAGDSAYDWFLFLFVFQIESLPPELFQCRKLRTLHLGNNVLQSLPSRVGELTNLSQIELRGNRLECLPVELGECPLLKRSGLVVEEDLFNTLPLEVKERLWRADKEQAWAPGKKGKASDQLEGNKRPFQSPFPQILPFLPSDHYQTSQGVPEQTRLWMRRLLASGAGWGKLGIRMRITTD